MDADAQADLLIIGGGINGAGIARDAAGRGLSVVLCEKDDLAGATSSASSKLIHGGLRYLEHYEFRLVREALAEREVLLRAAPHLVHPMRFIMPHAPELRPAWMIRAGLLLYDYLARRQTLPASERIDLTLPPWNDGLKSVYSRGYAYSDCRVDDARLVIANARAAAALGAEVLTRTRLIAARREGGGWRAVLRDAAGAQREIGVRAIVNAAGPWVGQVLTEVLHETSPFRLKLVQGSHIVVRRLYQGRHAFILQNDDRRVVFVYPYEQRYTLIGTTDVEVEGGPEQCGASDAEVAYLCRAAGRYFVRGIEPGDVVWRYCGVRPLFDDGATDPSAVTRDYVLHVAGNAHAAPVLSVFGGKITTYRRLAQEALERLRPWFPRLAPAWTARALLPGGDLAGQAFSSFADERLGRDFPWLEDELRLALAHRHGGRVADVLGDARSMSDLGEHFGAGLYAREVDYFVAHEWARSAEDVLWRRTKAGLHLPEAGRRALERRFARRPT
jgi:glycerol-3-phosphate dehydrogenase